MNDKERPSTICVVCYTEDIVLGGSVAPMSWMVEHKV